MSVILTILGDPPPGESNPHFPNMEATERLIDAVLMEIDEAWTTGHRYFDMAEYYTLNRT